MHASKFGVHGFQNIILRFDDLVGTLKTKPLYHSSLNQSSVSFALRVLIWNSKNFEYLMLS